MHRLATICLVLTAAAPASAQYYPPVGAGDWQTADPVDLGWNTAALADLDAWMQGANTKAFLVLKDGRIAHERYFDGFGQDSTWTWFSAGKSLTAVLVGFAVQEGLLSIEEATTTYLSRWTFMTFEREVRITVRHQLTMTTGLDETAFFCTARICLTYRADPETRWVYHNAPYSLLRNVIQSVSGEDYTDFTRSRLGPAIGMDGRWEASGYNNFFHSTARSAARFGLMMQHGATWDGVPVLTDTAYVRAMTRPSQDLNPSYGYLWWLNGAASYIGPEDTVTVAGPLAPHAPSDAFVAAGSQGQFVAVAPSRGLVWVRFGDDPGGGLVPIALHDEIWRRLMEVVGTEASAVESDDGLPLDGLRVRGPWPNPASTATTVAVDYRTGVPPTVTLFDLLGRRRLVVAEEAGSGDSGIRIPLDALSAGLYVWTVVAGGSRASGTLVVNH